MFKRILFSFLFLFSIYFTSVSAYYNPGKPDGFVNDYSSSFTYDQETKLETVLKEFKNKNGGEIAVVVVKSFKGDTKENFAVKLFEDWGIGDSKDRGVLILISKEDREVRVEVGYGFEGDLPDAFIDQSVLSSTNISYLSNNQYYAGVSNMVSVIFKRLNFKPSSEFIDNSTLPSTESIELGSGMQTLFVVVFIIILLIIAWLFPNKPKGPWWSNQDKDSYKESTFSGGRSGGGGAGKKF